MDRQGRTCPRQGHWESTDTWDADGPSFDYEAAFARAGGDSQLLAEIASMFLDQSTRMIDELQDALRAGDAQALVRASHAIKGSVGNFSAHPTMEVALRLEGHAQNGNFRAAGETFEALRWEIDRLRRALSPLAAEYTPEGD